MDNTIYNKLSEHLDKLSAGFPKSKNDSELKLLKKFYSEEQAEIALALKPYPEKASVIAERLKMDADSAAEKIEHMAKSGLVFRINTPDGPLYMQTNFIMGIYEFNVNSIDREIAEYVDDYYDALLDSTWKDRENRALRVVPVNSSIEAKDKVESYDRIRDFVKGNTGGPYAAAPCICRVEQTLKGNEVHRPKETCLTFGVMAQYYIDNGTGKQLSEAELMDKLDECDEAALVPFGTNSREIINMCMCDKDSCQLFRNLRKYPRPAEQVNTRFYAEINKDLCSGCTLCLKRCQIDAIQESSAAADGKAALFEVDTDRCIGCGLCVSKCPKGALTLKHKAEVPDVPENLGDLGKRMKKERKSVSTA